MTKIIPSLKTINDIRKLVDDAIGSDIVVYGTGKKVAKIFELVRIDFDDDEKLRIYYEHMITLWPKEVELQENGWFYWQQGYGLRPATFDESLTLMLNIAERQFAEE